MENIDPVITAKHEFECRNVSIWQNFSEILMQGYKNDFLLNPPLTF